VRRQDAMGAYRHRGHGARLAAVRHQQGLDLGLGRAASRPVGARPLRKLKAGPAAMTEFLFYHLQGQPVERVLPVLLERSVARGWRVVVQTSIEERLDALDAHLWTYTEEGFLPHGTFREATALEQPVLLTIHDHNPNGATVRFLIDSAPVPADA